jgi:hypothetical protein
MTRVGLIYGADDAGYVGITEGEPVDSSEDVDVDLTDAQHHQAVSSLASYRSMVDDALAQIDRTKAQIKSAQATYAENTAWLVPLHAAAVTARDDAQWADRDARAMAEAKVAQAELAAEDAKLGPRLFVTTERPARETHRMMYGSATRLRLHRRGCPAVSGDPNVREQDGLRMDDACDLYVKGALACGRCKPDTLMAADPVNGKAVDGARFNRESKVVKITLHQLQQASRGLPWRRGDKAGLVVMSPATFEVVDEAVVIGWRDPANGYGESVPEKHREALFQFVANRRGWVAWWNTQLGREGYLIARAMTKAEIRAGKESK